MSMRLLDLSTVPTQPITLFDSVAASSRLLAGGRGETHVHWLRFEPGAKIGRHPTGFGQLFLVIEGSGWAMGADGRRIDLTAGQAVFFERGEHHAKGSDSGMTVLMVQVTDLQLSAPVSEASNQ
jgi:quercetin dioxygenase-like cupin family protein